MVGASFLGLHDVKTACSEFLQSRFHPQNVLGIRCFADMLSCTQLLEQSNKYIRLYFEDVSQSDEFLNLSFDELREIIAHDDLNINSEREAFDAIIRWLKHDSEFRKNNLPELLSQVRLPLLTPEYLIDHVAKEELIRTSHQCRCVGLIFFVCFFFNYSIFFIFQRFIRRSKRLSSYSQQTLFDR